MKYTLPQTDLYWASKIPASQTGILANFPLKLNKSTVPNLETNQATGLATRAHSLTPFMVFEDRGRFNHTAKSQWEEGKISVLVTIFVSS